MKIVVDKENKVVIARGTCKGKIIKAVAVCKEQNFDENFGKELAKKKYKIKEKYTKMRWHESEIAKLKKQIKSMTEVLSEHNRCADAIDKKLQNDIIEIEKFLKKYFED